MPQKLRSLLDAAPTRFHELSKGLPRKGLYLLSEGPTHLYVGRSNRLRQRLRSHCQPSGDRYTATFAFRMARMETGRTKATYAPRGSRAELERDPEFQVAFRIAKTRVSRMTIRVVEENDPIQQALLEIYAATYLRTPYNDFDNH